MDRKNKTIFLSELLEKKFLSERAYWSKEVTLDCGRREMCRPDYIRFKPENQSVGGIERGEFTIFEIKSCKKDFNSGHGVNFVGDKNYVVTDMDTYKQIINEIPYNVGCYVAIPFCSDIHEEFKTPTSFEDNSKWELKSIKRAHKKDRNRPTSELLFCMLRSGK